MDFSWELRGPARRRSRPCLLAAAILSLALASCSQAPPGPPRKATVPVSGVVHVDGQPAANVMVSLQDVKGVDSQNPTFPQALTDPEGKFQIATYASGDGAPEGSYQVTFRWMPVGPRGPLAKAPDKLRGRYSNPTSSKHHVTVTPGTAVDLGTILLTSK